jgi:hypothetical protein
MGMERRLVHGPEYIIGESSENSDRRGMRTAGPALQLTFSSGAAAWRL